MFWSLGAMLKRFFEAKSFIFHIPKPVQVPKITYFGYFCKSCMYMHHVRMLCMSYMYVFYVCIICMHSMYSTYVSFVFYVCILCILCMHSMYASVTVCISYNYRKTEAKRIIKHKKDAPWCTDHFSYWTTT